MSRFSTRLRAKELEAQSKVENGPNQQKTKAPTKTSRKKQKVAEPAAHSPGSPSVAGTSTSNPSPGPATNKPPAIWAKVRGKRGHLKMVVEMPFDILLEIFQHLNPIDLLHLSWSSRAMRGLILDRTIAMPLWKSAFSRVTPTPPPCPDGLPLPQYANLLFGKTCFGCNAVHGLKRLWKVYSRLCKVCIGREFIDLSPNEIDSRAKPFRSTLCTIVPFEWLSRAGPNSGYAYCRALYYRPAFESILTELERLDKAKESQDDCIAQLRKDNETRRQMYSKFTTWERAQDRMKKAEVENRKTNRQMDVRSRLEPLGFTDVLDRLHAGAILTLPGVKGTKPLTEREWNRIQPLLVDTLLELRKTFLKEDCKRAVSKRTWLLNLVYEYFITHNRAIEPFAPRHTDVAKRQPFKGLIFDTPLETTIQQADFIKLLDELPAIVTSWREEAEAFLLELIPTESHKQPSKRSAKGSKGKEKVQDATVLQHAKTIFACKWCPEILLYPTVLRHHCFYLSHSSSKKPNWEDEDDPKQPKIGATADQEEEEDEGEVGKLVDPSPAWNEDRTQIRFDDVSSEYATAIIQVLGKDPATVTYQELEEDNQRVECTRCRKPKYRFVMDWRSAIIHEHAEHGEDEDEEGCKTSWEKLDPLSLEEAHVQELKTFRVSSRPEAAKHCAECTKGTIVNDEVARVYNNARWMPVQGQLQCREGHDLSTPHSTFRVPEYNFQGKLRPVRLPLVASPL